MPDRARRPARRPRRDAPPRRAPTARKGRLSPGRDLRLCLTSVPAPHARRLAQLLVGARVAACVSVLAGAESVYRWKGKVERAAEALLLVKASAKSLPGCIALLSEAHPYEVPEIVVVTPTLVGAAYVAWVQAETR